MVKQILIKLILGLCVLIPLGIRAYAIQDDIWFGTGVDNPTPITQITVAPGQELNLYIYGSSTDRLLGSSLALTWGNGFEFSTWSADSKYVTHIGGPSSVALDGLMTLADNQTQGYVFETGPVDVAAWNGLMGVLKLQHTLDLGQFDTVSIWTDGASWSKSSAIYDMDTFGHWVGKDLTVQAVPEPSSVLSLLTGFIGLLGLHRRHSRRPSASSSSTNEFIQ